MKSESAPWLRWVLGMGERRKLGDVAMDILLFAGMVSTYIGDWRLETGDWRRESTPTVKLTLPSIDDCRPLCCSKLSQSDP